MLHFASSRAHRLAQQQFSARRKLGAVQRFTDAALVGDREVAELFDLVPEEFDAGRMLGDRREHIEDAAAHRELAASRDHVDAGVGQVDELAGNCREVVAASAGGESDRFELGEVVGERLECGPNGCDEDEVAFRP